MLKSKTLAKKFVWRPEGPVDEINPGTGFSGSASFTQYGIIVFFHNVTDTKQRFQDKPGQQTSGGAFTFGEF